MNIYLFRPKDTLAFLFYYKIAYINKYVLEKSPCFVQFQKMNRNKF